MDNKMYRIAWAFSFHGKEYEKVEHTELAGEKRRQVHKLSKEILKQFLGEYKDDLYDAWEDSAYDYQGYADISESKALELIASSSEHEYDCFEKVIYLNENIGRAIDEANRIFKDLGYIVLDIYDFPRELTKRFKTNRRCILQDNKYLINKKGYRENENTYEVQWELKFEDFDNIRKMWQEKRKEIMLPKIEDEILDKETKIMDIAEELLLEMFDITSIDLTRTEYTGYYGLYGTCQMTEEAIQTLKGNPSDKKTTLVYTKEFLKTKNDHIWEAGFLLHDCDKMIIEFDLPEELAENR